MSSKPSGRAMNTGQKAPRPFPSLLPQVVVGTFLIVTTAFSKESAELIDPVLEEKSKLGEK